MKKNFKKIAICQVLIILLCCLLPIGAFAAPNEELLNGFTIEAENENFILYSNKKEAEIAVLDKKSNDIWWSNPPDRENDQIAIGAPMMALSSQLTVRFVDAKGAAFNATSKLNSVNKNGAKSKKVANGIEFTMDFTKEKFKIPIRYTLTKDHLKVEIVTEGIEEYGDNKIVTIGVLPFLGAGGLEDEGYLMVPDGSGALINFNNGKNASSDYSEVVYGEDPIYDKIVSDTFKQQIMLPVFGIKKNNSGMLAVIAENEARGVIKASVSGKLNSYNNVYAEFQFRSFGSMSLPQKNFVNKDTTIVERLPANSANFEIRYYFLGNEKNDYNAMAETYRNYLIAEKKLVKATTEGDIPFYLDLYGFVKKKKPVLGIPFEKVVELTTFKDAEEIIKELNEGGVKNTILRYNGWIHKGYLEKIPTKANVEKKLGGQKGLNSLVELLEQGGGQIFLGVDFVNVYETGNKFSKFRDASKTAVNSPAMQYKFNLNVYTKDYNTDPWYLTSPKSLLKYTNAFAISFEKLKIKNLALDSIGSKVHSDLGVNGFPRDNVPGVYEEMLNINKTKFESIMVVGGNAYSIPYASHIIEVPSYSSNFDMEDETIPFYQLVVHGLVSYSSQAVNLSSNPEIEKLRCIETGSYPLYSWIGRNTEELKNTRLNHLFSADYKTWIEGAIKEYKEINSVLSKVATQKMVFHEKLQDGVVKVSYENGTNIIVNYNKEKVTIGDKEIGGLDYIVFEEGR